MSNSVSDASARPAPARMHRARSLGLLAILLLGVGGAVGYLRWQGQRIDRAAALALAQEGHFAEAEPLLRERNRRHPNDLPVARELALGYRKLGHTEQAEAAFADWCNANPPDVEAFQARLQWRMAQRRLPAAIDDAERILELQPQNDEVREKRAQWLASVGQLPEADAECRHCLEHQPRQIRLQVLAAIISYNRGDQTRTEELIQAIAEQSPRHDNVLLLRAALELDAGRPEPAIPLLREVIAQGRASRIAAQNYLAQALARAGKDEEARRVLAEIQQRHASEIFKKYGGTEHGIGVLIRIAEAQIGVGQKAEGVRLLQEVLVQAPECAAAHHALADFYAQEGQADKAAEHRRRAQQ